MNTHFSPLSQAHHQMRERGQQLLCPVFLSLKCNMPRICISCLTQLLSHNWISGACIIELHPEQGPFSWKDPLPGRQREKWGQELFTFLPHPYLKWFWISWCGCLIWAGVWNSVMCRGECSSQHPWSHSFSVGGWAGVYGLWCGKEQCSWGLRLCQAAASSPAGRHQASWVRAEDIWKVCQCSYQKLWRNSIYVIARRGNRGN